MKSLELLKQLISFPTVSKDSNLDLIDFNYGPGHRNWHSPFDTLDKLGPVGFQAVGETALSALPAIGEQMLKR